MNIARRTIRIGTRRSKLALVQTERVRRLLMARHRLDADAIAVMPIQTSGDRMLDRPLADIGGKGLFCKELEQALRDREIDLAVHSMKDMETHLPSGMAIGCVLERDDPRDAFVSLRYLSLAALPQGAVIGTSSVRRRAQLLSRRPDLRVVECRGNVLTRLTKLEAEEADALMLAAAGLKRLEMVERITEILPVESMIPAAAQGAIATEIREDDEAMRGLLAPLHHDTTAICVTAERALLAALDGDCRTPIGAHATLSPDGAQLTLHGMLADLDGSHNVTHCLTFAADDPVAAGMRLGDALREDRRRMHADRAV